MAITIQIGDREFVRCRNLVYRETYRNSVLEPVSYVSCLQDRFTSIVQHGPAQFSATCTYCGTEVQFAATNPTIREVG